MKRFFGIIICIVIITVVLPLIIVAVMGGIADNSQKDEDLIKVYFTDEDEVKEINTAQYLVGVVAAEMPADFDIEALKAQAVAARTYMLYHASKVSEHKDGAVVCTDYSHCQAWVNPVDKITDKDLLKKVQKSVRETGGEVITYNGELINSVFFSTSSGKTENAADVWGREFDYLVSVVSEGEENSPNFQSEYTISIEEAKNKISENVDGVDFSKGIFGNTIRSDAGGIKTIETGGVVIAGTQLRNIFSLNSTNAEIEINDGNITFKVKGYGHGVGMSQYGAEAMACDGKNYKEILKHYYTDCEISQIS